MNVPANHLAWAQDKTLGKEHVLLPNFVRKFGFADKDSANGAFLKLINSNKHELQGFHAMSCLSENIDRSQRIKGLRGPGGSIWSKYLIN